MTAYIIGSLCGFPTGACICEKLSHNGIISEKDASKILPFCNNASPAFVIGAVGISILGNENLGWIIYISQFLSSAIPLLFINTSCSIKTFNHIALSVKNVFFSSIEKAVYNILKICAIICIFSAFLEILKKMSLSYMAILLEISNGISFCSQTFHNSTALTISLCSFCCSFSGICVHLQIKSMLKRIDIRYTYLFVCKFLQGILSFLFSWLFCFILDI